MGFSRVVEKNVLDSVPRYGRQEESRPDRGRLSSNDDVRPDWIAGQAALRQARGERTVVVTADILLAGRCVKAGACVLAPTGKPFTSATIGGAIATRAITADLRAGAEGLTGRPAPFAKADRSRFLQALYAAVVRLGRM
jgi:uncharacterized protein YaiI (UPF0178 family)